MVHPALLLLLLPPSALLGVPLLRHVLLLLLRVPCAVSACRHRPRWPQTCGEGRRLRRRVRLAVLPDDWLPAKALAPVVHLLQVIPSRFKGC